MRNLPGGVIGMLAMVLLLVSGCAATQPTRLYLLDAGFLPESHDNTQAGKRVLAVGPVEIPDYLDRPQIITQAAAHELHLSETDLWAESLKDAIPRLLARQIEADAGIATLVDPWRRNTGADYRLSLNIIRLYATLGKDAVLEARWSLMDEHDNNLVASKVFYLSVALESKDYGALAKAYSSLFSSLSHEVAQACKQAAPLIH